MIGQRRSKKVKIVAVRRNKCPNFSHGRPNTPTRFCSLCGEVVNTDIPAMKCDEQKHTERRRNRIKFCHACGKQLIPGE